jgi:hypothetical protein
MTLSEFQVLSLQEKANLLHGHGVYIGKRRIIGQIILLYQLEGFYVEVYYTKYRRFITRISCSASTQVLDPYLDQIPVEHLVSF